MTAQDIFNQLEELQKRVERLVAFEQVHWWERRCEKILAGIRCCQDDARLAELQSDLRMAMDCHQEAFRQREEWGEEGWRNGRPKGLF